jgi:16S rRNA (cytosine1402-N4)-methyltransferase
MQLDQAEKGFSFSKEGPLDMRMGPATQLTAREIVNHWPEKKLGELFRDYGEEPKWRQAAKAIVGARRKAPFKTTSELAEFLVAQIGFRGKKKLHPATLIFQALRICVNGELDSLEKGLTQAIARLSSGGRIGVISFHSLEDRIVKNIFREEASQKKTLRLLTKKPLVPTAGEMKKNPRARSAKMRFAEKL